MAPRSPDWRPTTGRARSCCGSAPRRSSDTELLAVVLGSGVRGRDALAVAADLLGAAGGVDGLARAAAGAPDARRGVGPRRAARICWRPSSWAAGPSPDRASSARGSPRRRPPPRTCCRGSARLREEHFGVLLLDTRHRLIRAVVISRGHRSMPAWCIRARCSAPPPSTRPRRSCCSTTTPRAIRRPAPTTCALTRRLVEARRADGHPGRRSRGASATAAGTACASRRRRVRALSADGWPRPGAAFGAARPGRRRAQE